MASSGWLGEQTIWSGYLSANVNVKSISHSGTNLRVVGTVRFTIIGTGVYANNYLYISGGVKDENFYIGGGGGATFTKDFDTNIGDVSESSTSRSFRVTLEAYGWQSGTVYWTVYFDASGTAPSGLKANLDEIYDTGAKISVSLSSYGSPTSSSRYIEAGILGTSTYGSPYRYTPAPATATSGTLVVDNSSLTGSTALTIKPNTKYWYGTWATNGTKSASVVSGTFITLPAFITKVTVENDGNNKITFHIEHGADGSDDTVIQEYSSLSGVWRDTGGDSFSVYTDAPDTFYFRRRNSSGETPTVVVNVIPVATTTLYGSVNEKSVKIEKLYAGVPDDTRFRLTEVVVTPPTQYHYAKLVDSDKFCSMLKNAGVTFTESTIVLSIDVRYDMVNYTATVSIGGTAVKLDGKTKAGLVQLLENCGFEFDADRAESVGSLGGDTDDMFPVDAYDKENAGPATSKRLRKLYAGDTYGRARLIFDDSVVGEEAPE